MSRKDIIQAEETEADIRRYPIGVRHLARWVRLCEKQGTRLVDLIERWVEASEAHNEHVARLANATERIANHADGYLGYQGNDDEEDDEDEEESDGEGW